MNVLIIDDSPLNTAFLNALVKKLEGCEPTCFNSSLSALEWCKSEVPDLVLVDYIMPEMDGLEFLRRFRLLEGRCEIPVLMVTSSSETEIRHQALELGANDFLLKPVDKVEFLARMKNMLSLRRHQKELADRAEWLTSEVKKATVEVMQREQDTIFRLAKTAEFRDPETGFHILRMAAYSQHVAKHLGLSEADQELLLKAAPMHDVGKVGTPDHILLKPGKLEPEEFEIMKQHSAIGHEILKGSLSMLLQTAAEIAISHHEKFDGSGYPNGLAGEQIPLFGRITAVADVFDALTSERPYKKAWEVERAKALIAETSGQHFDPKCVEAFFQDWENVLKIKDTYQDAFETASS